MITKRRRLAVTAVLSICLLNLDGVASALAQDAKPRTEVPVFKVGDEWKFRSQNLGDKREPVDYTNRIESVSSDDAWASGTNAGGDRWWWQIDAKQAMYSKRFDFSETGENKRGKLARDSSSDTPLVQHPLEAGKSYKVKAAWVFNGFKHDSEEKAEVVAFEKVKVPAGEFDAYRIETSGFWNNRGEGWGGRMTKTLWYAPQAKQIVKSEFKGYHSRGQLWNHHVAELLEFKAAKD